ncbi:hypothetical protein [Novosphingobium terrae]|uniref:hypothetical protein n=1 Tax=Novosphingobium terrae TaxID=2726189 RepID=UPI0019815824|nr:hypothetical protein [Novosphingobium terrae]
MESQALLIGGVISLSGLAMLAFSRKQRLAAVLRKAQLAAGESEAYFEEGRSIQTYPTSAWRLRGVLLTFIGIIMLIFAYVR